MFTRPLSVRHAVATAVGSLLAVGARRLMLPGKTPQLRFTAQRSLARYLPICIDLFPEVASPMHRAFRVTQWFARSAT